MLVRAVGDGEEGARHRHHRLHVQNIGSGRTHVQRDEVEGVGAGTADRLIAVPVEGDVANAAGRRRNRFGSLRKVSGSWEKEMKFFRYRRPSMRTARAQQSAEERTTAGKGPSGTKWAGRIPA